MTFAHDLKRARRELCLTQAELAALLGVDKQSISNWECGRNAPWPARQMEISKQLRAFQRGTSSRPSINERILIT